MKKTIDFHYKYLDYLILDSEEKALKHPFHGGTGQGRFELEGEPIRKSHDLDPSNCLDTIPTREFPRPMPNLNLTNLTSITNSTQFPATISGVKFFKASVVQLNHDYSYKAVKVGYKNETGTEEKFLSCENLSPSTKDEIIPWLKYRHLYNK